MSQSPQTTVAETAPAEGFFLPELPRLLPCAYHPDAARIEIASNGWVRRMLGACFASEAELLYFLRQRNGIYGPLTVPKADPRRARDIADWYQFVTVIDSFVSDGAALGASDGAARREFARIMAEFDRADRGDQGSDVDVEVRAESGPGTGEQVPAAAFPYGRAASDLWRRIGSGLSARQRARFAASLEAFLSGCATEIGAKLAHRIPDYETCMAVRVSSFGCDFIELMTEYAAEVDLSEPVAAGAFDEVHEHCMRQMIIINDLLSWRKEYAQRDVMTVVRVLCEHDGLGLQAAVDRLCELVEYHEKSYIAARDRVLDGPLGGRADVRAYLDGLDHLIGGSQEFEYLTPRYFGDGSVWDGSTSGWLSLTAPIARFLPAPPAATG